MDARCSSLDATEVHFIIDSITAACVEKSSDGSLHPWLLNQRMQEVLLNGISVEDASLDGLVSKELLLRMVDAAKAALGRMSNGFSEAIKSLKPNVLETGENDAAPEKLKRLVQPAQLTVGPDDGNTPMKPGKHHRREMRGKQLKIGIKLRMHERRRHGHSFGASLSCKECDKTFKWNSHLARHQLTHSGVKPFECESCKKSFSRKFYLRVHQMTHSREPGKHHQCPKCGKQFDIGIKLRMHERRRHGSNVQRSFSCDECKEIFSTKANLKRHNRTHTGAKPFECEICHKSFSRMDKLGVHLLVHSRDRPFSCTECGYRYATSVSLKKHRKIHRAAFLRGEAV